MVYSQKRERPSTQGDIIRIAVDEKFRLVPGQENMDPSRSVASQLGIEYSTLRAIVNDEQGTTVARFALVMKICNYPEGFDELRAITFPERRVPQVLRVMPMRTKAL